MTRDHVPIEHLLTWERIWALLALKFIRGNRVLIDIQQLWMLRLDVNRQILFVSIIFIAILTLIILAGVNVLVLFVLAILKETLVAQFANVRIVLGVPPNVTLQVCLLIAGIVTQITLEELLLKMNDLVPGNVHWIPKCLTTLVALKSAFNAVRILQMFHQLCHVAEVGCAFEALMGRQSAFFLGNSEIV